MIHPRHLFAFVLGILLVLYGFGAWGQPAPIPVMGVITPATPAAFASGVDAAKAAGAKELVVFIDSPGGRIDAALVMARKLRDSGLPSRCVVGAQANSAAFLLLQSCTVRVAGRNSVLATHQPYLELPVPEGSTEIMLTVETLVEAAEHLVATVTVHNALIAARLGMPAAEYGAKVADARAWVMTAQEALAARAIDQIAP